MRHGLLLTFSVTAKEVERGKWAYRIHDDHDRTVYESSAQFSDEVAAVDMGVAAFEFVVHSIFRDDFDGTGTG
jgi:hypothetical protein